MGKLDPADAALYIKLKEWRKERAEALGTVPFSLFTNAMLATIAEKRPKSLEELREIKGVGEGRLKDYGEVVLKLVQEQEA